MVRSVYWLFETPVALLCGASAYFFPLFMPAYIAWPLVGLFIYVTSTAAGRVAAHIDHKRGVF